jgi:hypothetical protein
LVARRRGRVVPRPARRPRPGRDDAAKELVRVAVNVEAGTGKLDAQMRSHKSNAGFGDCVVKAFEKRRFKKGKQGFIYNSDYQI